MSLLIIPAFFVNGYFIRAIRHVSTGEKYSLPEWNDWGELARTGFKYALVFVIYLSPAFIALGAFVLFPILASALSESKDGLLAFLMISSAILTQVIFMIVGLAFSFWLPAVEIRLTNKGTIRSCFQFKVLYQFIKDNIKVDY